MKHYLSAPLFTAADQAAINAAIASGWIAPFGPDLDRFEQLIKTVTGAAGVVALSSGTAAIHLALRLIGLKKGDLVIVPSLTFAATAFPILYEGGIPLFIDVEEASGNLDADILEQVLKQLSAKNRLPRAIMAVHLFGMPCDMDRIMALARQYNIPVIEDAAEALGSKYWSAELGVWQSCGSIGDYGVLSFNGNKIVTTSGGGALLTKNDQDATTARKMATQSREPVLWYEHQEIGYNYRLSNILAAAGHSQISRLSELVAHRQAIFDRYLTELADLGFSPQVRWSNDPKQMVYAAKQQREVGVISNRWLPVFKLLADASGWNSLVAYLSDNEVEARPCWKPLHLQPVFADATSEVSKIGLDLGYVQSENWFKHGICLPTGPRINPASLTEILELIRSYYLKL